jgi:curved DNA-binding protein CbpA
MTQDYYRVLGVRYDAPKEEIRQAYLQLARKYHPDVNKEREAEEFLKSINEAYNILTNDEARVLYDQDLDIPPPWMRTSVRAALVVVCLGLLGGLTWYGFSLKNNDVVVASSGQESTSSEVDPVAAFNAQTRSTNGKNLEPTALPPLAKTAPVPKPTASALPIPKGSVSSKATPKTKPTAQAQKKASSIASVKVATISKSWNKTWSPQKLAFSDTGKSRKANQMQRKSSAKSAKSTKVALAEASAVGVEREPKKIPTTSQAEQKRLTANLPFKALSYRASPSEILSTISIPMDDGTSVPADTLLKVDTRIWNWKSGALRKKFSKFINALIVSRDVDLASEESGLSLSDVRYLAKQANSKQVDTKSVDKG